MISAQPEADAGAEAESLAAWLEQPSRVGVADNLQSCLRDSQAGESLYSLPGNCAAVLHSGHPGGSSLVLLRAVSGNSLRMGSGSIPAPWAHAAVSHSGHLLLLAWADSAGTVRVRSCDTVHQEWLGDASCELDVVIDVRSSWCDASPGLAPILLLTRSADSAPACRHGIKFSSDDKLAMLAVGSQPGEPPSQPGVLIIEPEGLNIIGACWLLLLLLLLLLPPAHQQCLSGVQAST